MKNYAKVGGKAGKPGYRTSSTFQYKQKAQEAKKTQAKRPTRAQNLARRMEHPRPKS